VAIADEMTLLKLYAEMESLRFDGKFDFRNSIDASINRFMEIPTMILQPFVENAINHGLRYKAGKGKLEISFKNQDEYILCIIEDDGVGRIKSQEIQSKSKKGYVSQGLKITSERLNTFNKINETDIQFSILDSIEHPTSADEDIGTKIIVKFPKSME